MVEIVFGSYPKFGYFGDLNLDGVGLTLCTIFPFSKIIIKYLFYLFIFKILIKL